MTGWERLGFVSTAAASGAAGVGSSNACRVTVMGLVPCRRKSLTPPQTDFVRLTLPQGRVGAAGSAEAWMARHLNYKGGPGHDGSG
jgi:hypothetical protein